jgi:two-component system, OmpR family, phosphate regulon sensor histidine kinase PhoR
MADRFSETRRVSTSIASLTTAFLIVVLTLLWLFFPLVPAWTIVPVSVALFVFSFYLSKYNIERFIYRKIKLIYKNIHSFRSGKANGQASEKQETLDNVNESVLEWGTRQRTEIEELKKMAAYRREFLGNVSHELKTPIF